MDDDVRPSLAKLPSQDVPFFVQKENAKPETLYEWVFTLGMVNVGFCAFLIGRYPEYYGYWHVIKSVLLLGNRLLTYTRSKKQFYLLDFCYMANYYSAIYYILAVTGVLTQDQIADGFWLLYSYATGPLAWSIFLLRNSMVLHSLNKTTDLFIHASPALLAWAMRWSNNSGPFDICGVDECNPSYLDLFIVPLGGYLIWWAIYTLWMMTCGLRKVDKGYDLVYTLLMRTNPAVRSFISPFGDFFGPIVYMLFHALGCTIFFALSLIFWSWYWVHTLFLLFLILLAVRNGASFYIKKVFRTDLLLYSAVEE